MSRIVVKGLTSTITAQDLRSFFEASVGIQVTDARIVRRRDGTSRQMGFVGFKESSDGSRMKEIYNGGYLLGCRISIAAATQVSNLLPIGLLVSNMVIPFLLSSACCPGEQSAS